MSDYVVSVDLPARIVILGAGPIGLEAGLYARYLGYDVTIIESGDILQNVRRWGHVRMFSPFAMNRSSLGLAALAAHDPGYTPPSDGQLLTGDEWIQRYLLPLSRTDLLADHILTQSTVASVARSTLLKSEIPGAEARGEDTFRVLVHGNSGQEFEQQAEIVIDSSGVFANPNWMGRGGAPAPGEAIHRNRIEYGLPDVMGERHAEFGGRRILLIGAGYSAATSIVALAQLVDEDDKTQVTWITRHVPVAGAGPIRTISGDRLAERSALSARANNLALDSSRVEFLPGRSVQRIDYDDRHDTFQVQFTCSDESVSFDRIIANVGYGPDRSLYDELQVHECYATQGPMKLAAALLGEDSADCLDQRSHGAQTLRCPEPNFYIIGAKSYGRNSNFLMVTGLEQIRELFSVIGGRAELNLYTTALAPP